MNTRRIAVLLTVAFTGMVALIALELMRGSFDEEAAAAMLAPLVILLCASSLPITLLSLTSARWSFWISFVITGLLTLFHAIHVVEHVAAADYALSALMFVTMLVPSAGAVLLLWKGRKADQG